MSSNANYAPASLEDVIPAGIVCSQELRTFFKRHLGTGFRFKVEFQKWLKENAGKTYADAVNAYKTLEHPGEIWPQFEYNQYVRDFFADNKGASLNDVIMCWHWKKLQPGSHRYNRSDIDAVKMKLESSRIRLRHWRELDAETLFRYASDPDVGPRAGWPPHKSVEESLEVIRTFFNNGSTWAIALKETDEAIGCIGYYTHNTSNIPIGDNDCEVGYWIAKPYWNRGLCTEALRLVLDYCINVKRFDNIWADHFTGNPASGRVMEKCGFTDTGLLNRCSQLVGGDKDMVRVLKYAKTADA